MAWVLRNGVTSFEIVHWSQCPAERHGLPFHDLTQAERWVRSLLDDAYNVAQLRSLAVQETGYFNFQEERVDGLVQHLASAMAHGRLRVLPGSRDEAVAMVKAQGGSYKLPPAPPTQKSAPAAPPPPSRTEAAPSSATRDFATQQAAVLADPKMSTCEAYTVHGEPKNLNKDELKQWRANPDNWLPERRALHDELLAAQLAKSKALSEQMNPGKKDPPTIVVMRGNSGVGKTTTLRKGVNPSLKEMGLTNPDGAVNPDDLKYELRCRGNNGVVTAAQAHSEGSMIADKATAQLFEDGDSMVLDKRFGSAKELQDEVLTKAKAKGYKVIVIDVDASLATSCSRVEARTGKDAAPNVPFAAVEGGFTEVRTNRQAVAANPNIDEYSAYSTEGGGDPVLVADAKAGKVTVHDAKLWTKITSVDEGERSAAKARYAAPIEAKANARPDQSLARK